MRVVYQRFGGLMPKLMNRAPRYEEDLSPDLSTEARRLVPPEFYSLKPTSESKRKPDMFLHEIAVEDGGKENHVVLTDEDIPPKLQPFVAWLQQRAGVS
jgi:hypothetical protein